LARWATLILVLAVMAASAAAFAISEGLKVQKAAITAVQVPRRIFSPVCDCSSDRVQIAFRLTRSDRMTVGIVDSRGQLVRTLVAGKLFGRGKHHFTWNGLTNVGAVVPDGVYEPRVHLHRTAKTYVIPTPITVDTVPPRIAVVSVQPRTISPDGDARGDSVRVQYQISEHAHALLLVNGVVRARTKFERPRSSVDWYGKVDGRAVAAGTFRLALAAIDLAGNASRTVPAGTVTVRYVGLPVGPIRAARGHRVVVPVTTDAGRIQWVLRGAGGILSAGSSRPRLVIRAPRKVGTYTLTVTARGHGARTHLIVRKR
jgi:hypothetical protein